MSGVSYESFGHKEVRKTERERERNVSWRRGVWMNFCLWQHREKVQACMGGPDWCSCFINLHSTLRSVCVDSWEYTSGPQRDATSEQHLNQVNIQNSGIRSLQAHHVTTCCPNGNQHFVHSCDMPQPMCIILALTFETKCLSNFPVPYSCSPLTIRPARPFLSYQGINKWINARGNFLEQCTVNWCQSKWWMNAWENSSEFPTGTMDKQICSEHGDVCQEPLWAVRRRYCTRFNALWGSTRMRGSRGGQRKDWLATIKEWTDLNKLDLKERSLKESNSVELLFMFYFSNYK